ncbi:hypothetical protein VTI74DRAFT_5314 [Chaetomium olivicolor]
MVAIAYGGSTICLWEICGSKFIDWAQDGRNMEAKAMFFNPSSEANLLLVVHEDHSMSLFDTWTAALVHTQLMPQETGLVSASCSTDGKTVATVDTRHNIRVWDFESLTLLHHVISPYHSLRMVLFTSDSLGVIDLMDEGIRIWSPAVLYQGGTRDALSGLDLAFTQAGYHNRRRAEIKTLHAHPTLPLAIAGKANGQIIAFNTEREQENTALLYSHEEKTSIHQIAVSGHDLVASYCSFGKLHVWKLGPSLLKGGRVTLQASVKGPVKQLLFSSNSDYLLVATEAGDFVYRVQDGTCIGFLAFERHERQHWKWLLQPQPRHRGGGERQCFSLVADGVIRTYEAQTFPQRVEREPEVCVEYMLDEGETATCYGSVMIGNTSTQHLLAIEVDHSSGIASSSSTFLFDLGQPLAEVSNTSVLTLQPQCLGLTRHCKQFLGFSAKHANETSRLVFIHKSSWVCSIDLDEPHALESNHYIQHFFIPDDIVFTSSLGQELACIRKWMMFREIKQFT